MQRERTEGVGGGAVRVEAGKRRSGKVSLAGGCKVLVGETEKGKVPSWLPLSHLHHPPHCHRCTRRVL